MGCPLICSPTLEVLGPANKVRHDLTEPTTAQAAILCSQSGCRLSAALRQP